MTTQNDVTGDNIKSKVASNKYRDNWDKIFNKDKKMDNPIDITEAVVSQLRFKGVNVRKVDSPIFHDNGYEFKMMSRKSQLVEECRDLYAPMELVAPVTEELMEYCSIVPEWEASRNPTVFLYKVEIYEWGITIRYSASNFGKPVKEDD